MKRIIGAALALLLISGNVLYVRSGCARQTSMDEQSLAGKYGGTARNTSVVHQSAGQPERLDSTSGRSGERSLQAKSDMRVLSDGKVISLDKFAELERNAKEKAGELMRQSPQSFSLSSFLPELRVSASLGAAEVLAETSPESAIELLWPLEGSPHIMAMGYWDVFSVWYNKEPEAASEYLLKQNLMSEKWAIAVERVAADWARTGNSLLTDLVDAMPTERRDDVIVRAIAGSMKSPNGVAYDLVARISDSKRRQMVENWLRRNATE